MIDDVHPSLNAWSRWHWAAVRKESERWKWPVRKVRISTGAKPCVRPVVVTVPYFFPTRTRRNFDNYTPKFILDCLKGCLIPDDSSEVIEALRLRFLHDPKHPRTEITLHPT